MFFKIVTSLFVIINIASGRFLLPKSYEKVNFKFYNGLTSSDYSQFNVENITGILQARNFKFNKPSVLYISGWMQGPTAETSELIVNAYLKHQDVNLLLLDWNDYSVGLYTPVMLRISKISRMIGRGLVKLFRNGLSDKLFHCVGHSFGAHSCGIIGRELQISSNKKFKLGRITGLDPAGPRFFPPVYEQPLSANDGAFVDTIQSDVFFIGAPVPLGHASFFPNYNMVQPGCPPFNFNSFFDFVNDMCSHFHAVRYWVETLNPKSRREFSATRCSSWHDFINKKCETNARNLMGLDASPRMEGNFFLQVQTNRFYD